MFVDRKKQEGTSSAIFGVGTAVKCCELNRCAGRNLELFAFQQKEK